MRTLKTVFVLTTLWYVTLSTPCFAATQQPARGQDTAITAEKEALTQTALDYAEGWYEGNAERMERALHPELAKRVLIVNGASGEAKLEAMTAAALIQATRDGGGKRTPADQRLADVTVLDVTGNAATVKLVMRGWVDYMHLSKIDGHWKIVNVLWEITPQR